MIPRGPKKNIYQGASKWFFFFLLFPRSGISFCLCQATKLQEGWGFGPVDEWAGGQVDGTDELVSILSWLPTYAGNC